MHTVEGAVAKAVIGWCRPGGGGGFNVATQPGLTDRLELIADIVRELERLPEDHEVRTWKWKAKNLGRQMGQQSSRIYDLRCQLAEARNLVTIDKTGYRSMRDRLDAITTRFAEQNLLIFQLQKELRENRDPIKQVTVQDSYVATAVRNADEARSEQIERMKGLV